MRFSKAWALGAILPLGIAICWLGSSSSRIHLERARIAAPLTEVRSEIPGIFLRLNREEGSWVEKGEILFSFNSSEEEALLAKLQTKIDSIQQKLSDHLIEAQAAMEEYLNARSDEASGLHAYSEKPLARLGEQQSLAEQCKKELAAAQQEAAIAKSALERKNVASPASGFLTERKKKEGEEIRPGDPICLLCNTNALWIEAVVPESAASKIRIGQAATATLPSDPALKWKGELSWISPVALPEHAGIPIRIALKEGYPDCLRPNLQVQLTLDVR